MNHWITKSTVVAFAAILSPVIAAQDQNGGRVAVRADDGRWTVADRPWQPRDVSASSPLYRIRVADSPDAKSAIVIATTEDSPLKVGDRIDEIQLPGLRDREKLASAGHWRYQVSSASDFCGLAAKCVPGCLVRLRGVERTTVGLSHTISGPRVFAYVPLGADSGFAPVRDESGAVTEYVDVQTGEHFGPTELTSIRSPR